MPHYKLPYDRVIESESGHIVRFAKDTATYVPPVPMLLERVQLFGGIACADPAVEAAAAKAEAEAEAAAETDTAAATPEAEVTTKTGAKPKPANRE